VSKQAKPASSVAVMGASVDNFSSFDFMAYLNLPGNDCVREPTEILSCLVGSAPTGSTERVF
ncbi:MAG: hypothetical protein V3V86_05200, partial [Gammaproteobacteria bacterium]